MTRLVVVGGNGAGMSAASKAKRRAPDLEVVVAEAGPDISYSACGIPYLVDGTVAKSSELLVLSEEKAAKRGIEVRTRTRAVGFNPYSKEVSLETAKGRDALHYDKLLIATGAEALNPFAGGELAGIHTVRHLGDGVRIMKDLADSPSKTVAVVGGGLAGLEMTEAFVKRGAEVHLFQRGPRPLSQMDPDVTDGIGEWLADKGVKLHLNNEVKGFAAGKKEGRVGVVKSKEKDLHIDMALVAVGVRPSTQFATKSGIHALQTGHILVDDQMRTNFHDVWAAGDCVAARHAVTGRPTGFALALPSNRMGKVAGDNIAASLERIPGPSLFFPGVLGTTITRLFGLAFAQTGLTETEAKAEGFAVVSELLETGDRASYMPGASDMAVKMVADKDSGKLLGVQLAGPAESGLRINAAAVALQAGLTVRRLAEVEMAYAPPFSPVYDPILVAAQELAKKVKR